MPSSSRRNLRDIRRSYTGEDKASAEAGVSRDGLGLDRCSPQQRRFRALLAIYLFNANVPDTPFDTQHSATAFLSYTMTVSPWFNTFVCVVPGAAENAVGRLLASSARDDLRYGVPGLRVAAGIDFGTYHLAHLPTGAKMVVTRRTDFPPLSELQRLGPYRKTWSSEHYVGAEVPMAEVEHEALSRVPSMPSGMERILAALVARLDVRDPSDKWALGLWWYDPLLRPSTHDHQRRHRFALWGQGPKWELRWNGWPQPEDVIACLTAPVIGVSGLDG
ncbi:hypothetical protein [Amycolatopsis sp. PS_44_ISF1]|uniref:hypothetical protein n=1 Tax=Amycolatopsis sp. PS_44_ISF1 TaxID=2974917 RepID=UPI0028DFE9A7|nr:hypothetical protein [Amycolatopsis sp. PS_44_ISF1]MDT8916082.1 hypothetical protein [Amycolatopsis sp. PS_44_ISF1]